MSTTSILESVESGLNANFPPIARNSTTPIIYDDENTVNAEFPLVDFHVSPSIILKSPLYNQTKPVCTQYCDYTYEIH